MKTRGGRTVDSRRRSTAAAPGGAAAHSRARRRAARLLGRLRQLYPDADCELRHDNPLELLVATILSAQCTDARVNQVTADLFPRYPTAMAYVRARRTTLEKQIHSTGFFRSKAERLQKMAEALVERHDGEVPRSMDELTALSGVARKTANVVLGTAFGINDGIVVDTHVRRLAQRLGLSAASDPVEIEADLMALFPRPSWTFLGHALIWHGRRVCKAKKPACGDCALSRMCPSKEKM